MANRANFAGNVTNMTQTLSHGATAFQEQKRQSEYKSADRRLINKVAKETDISKKEAQKNIRNQGDTERFNKYLENEAYNNNAPAPEIIGERRAKDVQNDIEYKNAYDVSGMSATQRGRSVGEAEAYNSELEEARRKAIGDASAYGTGLGKAQKYEQTEKNAQMKAQGSATKTGTEKGKINKYNREETIAQQEAQGKAKEYGTKRGSINKYNTEETIAQQEAQRSATETGKEKGIEAREKQDFNSAYRAQRKFSPVEEGIIQANTDNYNKTYQKYKNNYNRLDADKKALVDANENELNYQRKIGEQKVSNGPMEYASGMYNKIGSYASNIDDLATFMDDIGSPQGPMIADYMRLYGKYFDAFKDIQNKKNKKDEGE